MTNVITFGTVDWNQWMLWVLIILVISTAFLVDKVNIERTVYTSTTIEHCKVLMISAQSNNIYSTVELPSKEIVKVYGYVPNKEYIDVTEKYYNVTKKTLYELKAY